MRPSKQSRPTHHHNIGCPLGKRAERTHLRLVHHEHVVAQGSRCLDEVEHRARAGVAKGIDGPAQLTAYDKATGRVIASVPLPAGATGAPISYRTAKGQRILIPTSSTATGGQWVVLALP